MALVDGEGGEPDALVDIPRPPGDDQRRTSVEKHRVAIGSARAGQHLAKRLGMSSRHLTRVFRAEVGVTPASWVQSARVSAARARFENGGFSTKQVAAEAGFPDINAMRRAFQRLVGITPAEYRRQFVAQKSI